MKDYWEKLKRWWHFRKYDRLTRFTLTQNEAEVHDIIKEMRNNAYSDIDEIFMSCLNDKKWMSQVVDAKSRFEARQMLVPIIKKVRQLILLQLQGNLEPVKPKEKK